MKSVVIHIVFTTATLLHTTNRETMFQVLETSQKVQNFVSDIKIFLNFFGIIFAYGKVNFVSQQCFPRWANKAALIGITMFRT